jgi:hypothetical protein
MIRFQSLNVITRLRSPMTSIRISVMEGLKLEQLELVHMMSCRTFKIVVLSVQVI